MKRKSLILLAVLMIGLLVIGGCGQEAVTPVEDDHEEHGYVQEEEYECDLDHDELPFEWSGEYTFTEGTYTMEFMESHDPSCAVAFVMKEGNVEEIHYHAHHIMEAHMDKVEPLGTFSAYPDYGYILELSPEGTSFDFEIQEPGDYIVFFEHFPHEFDLRIMDNDGNEIEPQNPVEYVDDHHHDHDHDHEECDHDHHDCDHDHEECDHDHDHHDCDHDH